MPVWAYHLPPLVLWLIMLVIIELIAILGLITVRKLLIPRIRFHDGDSEAISGTVQAIGVFYGVTVGLIAVGVWTTFSESSNLVSREAASIAVLYRDLGGYPEPTRLTLRTIVRDYTVAVIEKDWPAQKIGQPADAGVYILNDLQSQLYAFEANSESQRALHSETLRAYNNLLEVRRLRLDAVGSGLSRTMWLVIWIGAAISISVAYLYKIQDLKLHIILISLMAGFLSILLCMIVVNDQPFLGYASLTAEPYKLVLDNLINVSR